MPKISIIIAMFNIENYIEQCLQSCIHQEGVSLVDYEIIVVNDGATDNSLKKAEGVLKGISNARIVTRVNGGLSEARNTGLSKAEGEYVWFVDGDDTIASNAILVLLNNIKQSTADTYICNFNLYDGDKVLQTSHFSKKYSGLSGRDIHNKYCSILPMMAWLSINRRDFLLQNKLKFYPRILHEDFEYSVKVHHLSKKIVMIDDVLYSYRVNRIGSIMQQKQYDNSRSIMSYFTIIDSWHLFFSEQREHSTLFFRVLCGVWASLLFRMVYSGNQDKFTTNLLKQNRVSCIKYLLKGTLKHKIMGLGILLIPDVLLKIMIGNKGNRFV